MPDSTNPRKSGAAASRTAVQLGATLLSAAGAAGAMFGAWGAWTTGDAADQGAQAGVLDLDFGAGTITQPFGSATDPLVPGDTGCRTVMLVNDGNVDMAGVAVKAESDLVAAQYTDDPGNGTALDEFANPLAVDETVSPNIASFTNHVTVTVRWADGGVTADTASVAIPPCGDGAYAGHSALATTTLSALAASAATVDLGDGALGRFRSDTAALDEQDRKYLELAYAFAANAPETAQNVYGTLTWVFTADQRASTSQ